MYEVALSAEIPVCTDAAAGADQVYAVGNLPSNCNGCRCGGVYDYAFASHRCPNLMGAGSAFTTRNGATLSGRAEHDTAHHHGQLVPRSRCLVGAGRRVALPRARCGDRGILGRSGGIGFHRDQTAGAQVRSRECAVLVNPSCRNTKLKCSPRPLEGWIGPIDHTSLRCAGAGDAALVARSVSVAPNKTGSMDGDI